MTEPLLRRLLAPIVSFREGETTTGILMFFYSFLVMTAYNNIKPSATSVFISDLGAENLPWVMLIAGLTMGIIMQYYSRAVGRVPRRWVLPGTQAVVIATLVAFWFLLKTEQEWVSALFFFWGRLLLGIFLISQFWTLANDIYDPRQAKRVFGFIGAGASLGGITGAGLTALLAEQVGTENLLLLSAATLGICMALIFWIQRRHAAPEAPGQFVREESMGGGEALRMLRGSRHLQLIAAVIGFAALGAVTIEQQLNMAAEQRVETQDAITSFLAQITLYISAIGFFIQIWLTSRIHRILGIGFALLVLPVSLGATALLILFNPTLWAAGIARVLDSSLRYSLDKTTREVLFLPLPTALKYKAKPFVDVTADRFIGKGLGSIVLLVALNVFGATWYQLSFLSLTYCVLWIFAARYARREYLAVFRRSIEKLELEPATVRASNADPQTIETLVEELGSADERRVIHAIEILDSLGRRNLVTPLLLHHDSPRVRARALKDIELARPDLVERWLPAVERMLKDESPEVRASAVAALGSMRREYAAEIMRPYLQDRDPRIVATATVALVASGKEEDVKAAEEALKRLASDAREAAAAARKEAARAIAQIDHPRFRPLLIPLMYDTNIEVAREAIWSARKLGSSDHIFVPTLVSLLRHRRLKNVARQVLVSYGEGVLDTLAYFLRDADENMWVRRHIPGTIALIPSRKSVEILLSALHEDDGFLRYKAVSALGRLRREHPELPIDREPLEKLVLQEALRYFRYLGLSYNLFDKGGLSKQALLARALQEKLGRGEDRIYRLLGLIYPWKDMMAARWAIERGDPRSRASAVEYLDNVLTGPLRKRLMPVIEEMPLEEKVRRGNVFLKTRVRGVEETLARLIYDDDPVIAATAIDLVRQRKNWELAEDLEEVLAFRDAKDLVVFEAASYALAAYRVGEAKLYAV